MIKNSISKRLSLYICILMSSTTDAEAESADRPDKFSPCPDSPNCVLTQSTGKDPGPEGPALVHPRGVKGVITVTGGVQVSGVRFQQKNSTRWIGAAHKLDILSTVLAFSCSPISVQDSVFTDT